jgi:hypothetical protein
VGEEEWDEGVGRGSGGGEFKYIYTGKRKGI